MVFMDYLCPILQANYSCPNRIYDMSAVDSFISLLLFWTNQSSGLEGCPVAGSFHFRPVLKRVQPRRPNFGENPLALRLEADQVRDPSSQRQHR